MPKTALLSLVLLGSICAPSQIKRTVIPVGDALTNAMAKSSLTASGAKPFHIRVNVSEPENRTSPYQGTIEEWWISPTQWRREVTTKDGMRQTIVVVDGKKTERDEGDYFPLWLNRFVIAITDPFPDAVAWTGTGASITQVTMPNGDKPGACVQGVSKIGSGDRAIDIVSQVCFDGEGRLVVVGSPRYSMHFQDFHGFEEKSVARKLVFFQRGTTPAGARRTDLVGEVVLLEGESKLGDTQNLFAPLSTNDSKFLAVPVSSQQMEQLSVGNPPIQWPAVRSGDVKGRLAIYVSVDTEGHVREAWPLHSDNDGLDAAAIKQVLQWKMRPATDQDGNRVQVDGGLDFAFDTKIDDPLPVITGREISKFVSGCHYYPVLPKGVLPSGTTFKIQVSINEQGKNTGMSLPPDIPLKASLSTGLYLPNCQFKPDVVNGKATDYFIDFVFTAP